MSKKLLRLLQLITDDFRDLEFYSDDVLDTIGYEDPEFIDLSDELTAIESFQGLTDAELDLLKSLLVYLLARKDSFDKEDIYSLVFGNGKRIIWN